MADGRVGCVALLGAGSMGEALARGMLAARTVPPTHLWATARHTQRLLAIAQALGVQTTQDNRTAVERADLVLVAVKPPDVVPLLVEVSPAVTQEKVVVSIAAGVTIADLEAVLPAGTAVIRAMPNAAVAVRAGATGLALGTHAGPVHEAAARQVFEAVGESVTVREELIDAVTALSGSGPGFLAVVAEALADAGVRVGLSREVAQRLAAQTLLGTGQLLASGGIHPAALKDMVASPGGTTIAGLQVLERGAIRGVLMDAVVAAHARARAVAGGASNG